MLAFGSILKRSRSFTLSSRREHNSLPARRVSTRTIASDFKSPKSFISRRSRPGISTHPINEASEHRFDLNTTSVPHFEDGNSTFSSSTSATNIRGVYSSSQPRQSGHHVGKVVGEAHEGMLETLDSSKRRMLHSMASKLPPVPSSVISGRTKQYRAAKLTPDDLNMLGEIVKLLDSIVTQSTAHGASISLDLLRIVHAFPDQVCQWATLHLVDPRSRAAQLWGLGVLHALARLQHPLTIELWEVLQESDITIPVSLYIELCHYFGHPGAPERTESNVLVRPSGRYRELSKIERASALQSVLARARATDNTIVIMTCWNHAIQGLLAQDDIAGAEREWKALQRMNVTSPVELLQAFISAYSKHARKRPEYVEKVAAFHARIKHLNLSPDLKTYSEIMRCYERSRRYKDMDAVLLEMTQEEMKLHDERGATHGVKVKGPRATQLSSAHELIGSNPTHIDSKAMKEVKETGEESENVEDDSIEALKARRKRKMEISAANEDAQQQNANNNNSSILKVGNLVYTGGAQWAEGGRKHPKTTKLLKRLEPVLRANSEIDESSSGILNNENTFGHSLETLGRGYGEQEISSRSPSNTSSKHHESSNSLSKKDREKALLAERKRKLVSSWSRAIYSALSLGSLRKAMVLVEEMSLLGLEVNDRICTEFMFFAGKKNDLRLLQTWWRRLREACQGDLLKKHYLIYMRELLRLQNDVEARKVMSLICAEFYHSDDAYALWLRYYSNKGYNASVEQTLRQMEANSVEYGLYSISALAEMFAKKGNAAEMFKWLDRLKTMQRDYWGLDGVVSQCIYHWLDQGYDISQWSDWIEILPSDSGTPKYFPRTFAALLVTLASQENVSGVESVTELCDVEQSVHSPHLFVGLVRSHSLLPDSPKRDHTIVHLIKNCGAVKLSLSSSQNDEVMLSLARLPMFSVLLDWIEDLIAHPSHVAEPSNTLYKLASVAALALNRPERFVSIVTKSSDKYGSLPPLSFTMQVVRSVCSTGDRSLILYISAPLIALYPYAATEALSTLDEELNRFGILSPKGVPSPRELANPSTLDIPSYISRRMGMQKS